MRGRGYGYASRGRSDSSDRVAAVANRQLPALSGWAQRRQISSRADACSNLSRRNSSNARTFIATDIYRIANGQIAENWHLEDNLTFLQQIGVVAQ